MLAGDGSFPWLGEDLRSQAQEDAENTSNITQLLAELQPPQLLAHIPEKPAAQQVFWDTVYHLYT